MIQYRYFLRLSLLLLMGGCHDTPDTPTAFNVVGTYQLVGYVNGSNADDNPNGTLVLNQIDNQHVSITAKGTSGKTKIAYTYSNVSVVESAPINSGQNAYNLLYKGKQLGIASNDGISRYVDLFPSSTVTLKAVEF